MLVSAVVSVLFSKTNAFLFLGHSAFKTKGFLALIKVFLSH